MSFSLPGTPQISSFKPSKRHSLNPGSLPRPLHLINVNVPSAIPKSATTPLSLSFISPLSSPSNGVASERNSAAKPARSRRLSSISYFTSPDDSHRYTRHSRSLSIKASREGEDDGKPGAGSDESTPSESRPRPPLTLTEKHADLLQFIAQKESKCLELRSQLAVHEAELLALKRQWERVVNRGFDGPNGSTLLSSFSSATAGSQGGAVLEGIKEGVQGMSRFIAAGLSDLSSPASPSPPPSISVSRNGHGTRQSISSISTSVVTTSTRLSLSSVSSLGDDPLAVQVDTFAIPEGDSQSCRDSQTSGARTSIDIQRAKMYRRKSRDYSQLQNCAGEPDSPVTTPTATDVSVSPTSQGTRAYSSSFEAKSTTQGRTKRQSLRDSALPPPSSMPGLGSLALVGGSVPPMSTWVDSVGKKWEGLQKGTARFAKSQKRASVLFSDVSQSIFSTLGSPSPAYPSHSSRLSVASPLFPERTLRSSPTAVSLLDDDEDTLHACGALGSILTPVSTAKAAPVRPPPSPALSATTSDDDWNW